MSERPNEPDGAREEATARASSLEIRDEALGELSAQMVALVADYFARLPSLPVFPDTTAERLTEKFGRELPLEGASVERIVEDCRAIIDGSRHNGHPRFFGYVASPSTPVGAFADLLASALNPNVTSWRSAPAATEIEKTTLRWLSTLIGYGEPSGGLLTSGGSMANLNALLIAHRSRAQGEVDRRGLWSTSQPATVYASEQVHMSIPKAADILGLGRDQLRLVKSDARFRLDVRDLREMVEADSARGLVPFCVVGNAGTVNTGAVDPLAEIARVAQEHDLWFHVDGAYGAPGALDERKRALFDGIERADSVALDPHKWLYAPVDCGCLLFRDPASARKAFLPTEADYIRVHEETDDESFAFWDYGVELSRRFRALKVWMMLSYYGARRVRAAVSENNDVTAYFAERIAAAEDFELLAPVELSICCFRFVPPGVREKLKGAGEQERAQLGDELDRLNARIMHHIQRGGRAYLSNVTLRGSYGLRACIVNFRTTRADMDQTLEIVRDAARASQ
ncbi:MAG TPA: pyridoxal-dependent decarboxylase [Pyrinomonadaceae bacterium]|jgi:glutamate/tyrosine decarboxylase-like PLP-dependent enzyme|nr:pyridoxal-dependent decarboxylase [Pyrinomonadaceae bacterium]